MKNKLLNEQSSKKEQKDEPQNLYYFLEASFVRNRFTISELEEN